MIQQRRFQMQRGRIAHLKNLVRLVPHRAWLTAHLDDSCQGAPQVEGRLNVSDVGSPRQTIEQGEAIGQDSGAEGAEQNIFQGGFIRALFAAQETGEHVEAEGHGLEAQEHDDQVHAGGHEHHADTGKEQKRVVFALLFLFDLQVFHG